MRIDEPKVVAALPELGVELHPRASLAELTSLGIGGTTDLLRIGEPRRLPELLALLRREGIAHQFLGGGTNVLVADGELPWVVLQLAPKFRAQEPAPPCPSGRRAAGGPDVLIEGNFARVAASADLGRTVTLCAKADLGGMEGLIGVPGTVGGALRMNAGAYGTQIGALVREVEVFCSSTGSLETRRGGQISFDYRHTSFAPDDIMVAVKLELPCRPYREIIQEIRVCNEKRRASQPLTQKSAGCIFKNPRGASAGRMIDELGLKGWRVGDAMVSDRHANFFINAGQATCAEMRALIEQVRERVRAGYSVELEEEVIFWSA